MIKIRFILISLLVICLSGTSRSQESQGSLKDEIDLWLHKANLQHAGVGIYLRDSETGDVLAQTSPQLSLVPGSTLKLITTATALEMLGPDFRFETRLAYFGEIKNDTLHGDLLIVGGGDPALGSGYFKKHYLENHFLNQWVDQLKKSNITHITGNLITDTSIFEEQMIPDTWIWEDLGNYYGAGACALSVYDNLYTIHFSSPRQAGRATTIRHTSPSIPGLELENQVQSSDRNRDLAYVYGAPRSNKQIIRGTIPKGKTDFTVKASIPNPPYLLAWDFLNKIAENKITLDGFIQNQSKREANATLHLLTTTHSPRLLDIISVTNHESVNLFAEHLLKYMAYLIHGEGSTKKGIDVITDFWEKRGIDMNGLFLADGSGLSHFNALTTKQMVDILYDLKTKSSYGEEFFSTLPYVPNGTLYFFNPLNFPGESLRAKSGSMTRVRCYAGELTSYQNQNILFAIFLNNFSCSQRDAIKLVEDLLVQIAKK
ncbi:D-alanyl-D-alanine carboxypeptidase/D-alanyl-D-alanine endopeptidase [Sunxiuqinia sp. sy24]|uniref:D-alanyl-D-alanine carboxypeptidase/D-alanyl-D-alanine endopeptidase n=1 Tax=Sunxiuqinia sp. sy24 TaxID=3461495 RepID=UPI0040467A06